VIRGDPVWSPSDGCSLTLAGDRQRQNQAVMLKTMLAALATAGNTFAFLYNAGISNPASALND
jgi:hypothetical protein